MFKSFLSRLFAMVGIATLAGLSAAPASARDRPALWEVSDRDTTVYLFGTIHLLPKNVQWRSPKFEKALARSQSLVVETIVDDKNPQAFTRTFAGMAFRQGLPPILDRVSPAKRAQLEAAIAKTGQPLSRFDQMETWAVAFAILGPQFQQLGLSTADGVEVVLRGIFAQAGKPIEQLETNSEQLGLFDTLPEAAQRALLEGSVESPGDMRTQFNGMLSAWTRGDIDAIARTFNEEMASSPDLRDALIRRRNYNWSNWIARRMAAPGTVFMAVGAGHLAGPDSVQLYLQSHGYRVKRLQ
jgi:uncharacterized protein YbaP (TraB family)